MSSKLLGITTAITVIAGLAHPVMAESVNPPKPVNVEAPAAATTYSSIAVIWDKPEDYKDITGYNVYKRQDCRFNSRE